MAVDKITWYLVYAHGPSSVVLHWVWYGFLVRMLIAEPKKELIGMSRKVFQVSALLLIAKRDCACGEPLLVLSALSVSGPCK